MRGAAMRVRALSELIGSIYDTVVDPSACPTMLNRLAALLGATGGAQVGAYNAKAHSATMLAPRVDPKEMPSFSQYWADVWRQCDEHPIGAVIVPQMLISRQDRRHTEIFNGSSKPQRPERMMGATLLTEGSVSTVVSVSRPNSEGEFDAAQTRLFGALIPHLQRAVQLRLRLAALDGPPTSSAEMLNRLPHAVLLVDARARVIFANQAAARMLGAGLGLSLGRDGLQAETTQDTRRLRQTIADCAEPESELGGAGGRLQPISRPQRRLLPGSAQNPG
jgi:PAS domain-containing protein